MFENSEKLKETILRVLVRKEILIGSLVLQEEPPSIGAEDQIWQRPFSITLTEILKKPDFDKANQNSGRFQTVFEQIVEEYSRLTMYDMDIKETNDGVEVTTEYIDKK